MSAGQVQVTWLERAAPSLAAAIGVLAVGIVSAPWIGPALVLGVGAAAVLAWAGVWLVRRHGGEALCVTAVAFAILAGELSAVSFGGQRGRLLWADAALAAGCAWFLVRRRGRFALPPAALVTRMIPFLAWTALGLLVATDVLTGIAELKEWMVAFGVAVAALVAARDGTRARLLLAVVAVVGALIAAHLLYALVHSPYGPVLAVLLKQVDLPWGRSNYLAGILILSIPVTVGLLGDAATWRVRTAWLASLMIQATGVVVTASKGALLALIVALVVAFAGRGRASRLGLAVLAAVIGIGTLLYVYGPLQEALQYRMQATAVGYSVSERMDLYRLSIQESIRSPLWGIGINNFSVISHRFHGQDTVPHNLVLGYLVELGLPGLVLVLAWVVALGQAAWRWRARAVTSGERILALGLWAAFLTFVIHNQLESTIYGEQYKILLMIVAAATWRLAHGAKDPEREELRANCNTKRFPVVRNEKSTLQY